MLKSRLSTPEIYEDLRQDLTTGRLPQGKKLKMDALRAKYDCSASTIREVLFRLSSAELVEFEDQRGFRAADVDHERLHYLTKFRVSLETEGALASIKTGGLDWEAQLSAAHHKLAHIEAKIRKGAELHPIVRLWAQAEWEFHDTLIAACDSPFLRSSYAKIYDQFRQQKITQPNYGYHRENIAEHAAIVSAALARDPVALRQAIYEHMKRNLRDGGASGEMDPARPRP